MVEYVMIDKRGKLKSKWAEINPHLHDPKAFWFEIHKFRINGVQYDKWSEEFINAFNADIMWRKLND